MQVAHELFLRYDRASDTVLTGSFVGVRKNWLKRFFDITEYGDVIPKSVARQVQEVIAIARFATQDEKNPYYAEEAFLDYGAEKKWLNSWFTVDEDGKIGLDPDDSRKWVVPVKEKAPSPWIYAKLDAPQGYLGWGDGRYGRRRFG